MPHRTIGIPLKLRLREILPKHNDNESRYERIHQDQKPPGMNELLQIGVQDERHQETIHYEHNVIAHEYGRNIAVGIAEEHFERLRDHPAF